MHEKWPSIFLSVHYKSSHYFATHEMALCLRCCLNLHPHVWVCEVEVSASFIISFPKVYCKASSTLCPASDQYIWYSVIRWVSKVLLNLFYCGLLTLLSVVQSDLTTHHLRPARLPDSILKLSFEYSLFNYFDYWCDWELRLKKARLLVVKRLWRREEEKNENKSYTQLPQSEKTFNDI